VDAVLLLVFLRGRFWSQVIFSIVLTMRLGGSDSLSTRVAPKLILLVRFKQVSKVVVIAGTFPPDSFHPTLPNVTWWNVSSWPINYDMFLYPSFPSGLDGL